MQTIAIIPARYASTRFPGKPLVDIGGKTMIQRVVEQVRKAKSIDKLFVATDDERIFNHVSTFAEVVMTDEALASGTDRCAQVLKRLGLFTSDLTVVNVQGDEPFIQPEQINLLADFITQNTDFQIGTLAKRITDASLLFNPNIVKVVFTKDKKGLYFSRNPIPFVKGEDREDWLLTNSFYKHIGVYAYRAETLLAIADLSPSQLEEAESLEQLRWLENGYTIGVAETQMETIGIDTPEDLNKVL
jgi:3-deoxy-manno-octulosonate cytidylyltransferase (CMP-KDO synthetase)